MGVSELVNVLLKGLSREQLRAVADAAIEAGNLDVAKQLYRALATQAPRNPNYRARVSLTQHPKPRTQSAIKALRALEQITANTVYVGEGIATWLKLPPFMDDQRFLTLVDEHTHLSGVGGWEWNLYVVLWAAQRAKDLPGDFVELGVFRGHTTMFVADYVEFASWPKTWWLYDTFEGIPDDQVQPGWENINRSLYRGTFSFAEVRERFSRFQNIKVNQGRVPDVLHDGSPEAISFLHIDLNSGG